VHHFEERRHLHPPSNSSFPFIKFPSFIRENDPNVYLGWEAKVEQIFNVYEVQEDQKLNLASLEFFRLCHAVVASNCNGHCFEQKANRGLLV